MPKPPEFSVCFPWLAAVVLLTHPLVVVAWLVTSGHASVVNDLAVVVEVVLTIYFSLVFRSYVSRNMSGETAQPPPTIERNLEGLSGVMPPPELMSLSLLSTLITTSLSSIGVLVIVSSMYLFDPSFYPVANPIFTLGFVVAQNALALGTVLLLVAGVVSVRQLPTTKRSFSMRAKQATLGGQTITMNADLKLHLDHEPSRLVAYDDHQSATIYGHPSCLRWLASELSQQTDGGSRADVPQELTNLQHHQAVLG